MHFSIPETEVRSGENGSTYVVSMIIRILIVCLFFSAILSLLYAATCFYVYPET